MSGQSVPTTSNSSPSPTSSGEQASPKPRTRRLHIVPFGPPTTRPAAPWTPASEPVLPYWGGPVISQIHVVEVFWGSFVDAGSTTGLEQYFTDVTNSAYFDLLSEYGTVNVIGQGGAPGSNQVIRRGVFDGKYKISPSVCPGSAVTPPPTCALTDDQIQAELINQLSNLPAPVADSQGNFNTIYLIYFPPGVNITTGNSHSCVGGGFCAYHSSLTQLAEPHIPYGVFPDFSPASACTNGCGTSTAFNNLTTATSHEIAEAVTDVDISNATSFAPPLAWDSDQSGQEVGDLCNQQQAQITVGASTYTVQKIWSNMQNECVTSSAQFRMTTPTNAVPGEAFQAIVSVEVPGFGGVPLYDHTVHFTSSDTQAVLPPDYKFVPATDASVHTFSATLNSLNNQTITATDTVDPVIAATTTVFVSHNPDLNVVLTHNGNFTQGESGATYMLTVGNGGDRPTAGTLTVITSLPPDLTATAFSGSGWVCTPGTATCTRADALGAASHYPPITITTNVSATAPPSVVSSAATSGGGEVNSFNDTTNDPTTIVQLGDLTVSSLHAGSFSQGQTGATYALTVTNVGLGSSSGKVTVLDSLPSGLSATSITGTGWTCTLATLACTRTDALAASGTYPPITLTVNVANNTAASVTNSVAVSGGGEVNTANDDSADPTVITVPSPDLIVFSTHAADFTQGQAGATYSLIVTNTGPVASNGTVTVIDSFLPPYAMSATAIGGTGWSCTLSTLTCTRNDALAAGPGSSYPPITLTGTVSPVATSLTNEATVSGGGELDTTNNTVTDLTTILPWPDLVLLKSHQGNFSAGQIGATYTLTAVNNGAAPSFGTVTVTDVLPSELTATDISGSGWACTLGTLTCTRSDSVALFFPEITVTVNVATDAPSSVTNTATVSGGGEIYTADNTASDPTTLLSTLSITLQESHGTVSAGESATYSFSVAATGAGSIDFTCGTLPAKSACSFQPSTGSGSQTVNLTISTTANTNTAAQAFSEGRRPPLYALLLPLLGLLWTTRRRKRVETRVWLAVRLAAFEYLLLLASCGGASMAPPPNGTPPGTYTVTVTASNSTAQTQGTATVSLTVR